MSAAEEIGCTLRVLKLHFIPLSVPPRMVMAASRKKNECCLPAEAWPLVPVLAGEASLCSPLRVPSNAVPDGVLPQLQEQRDTSPAGCRLAPALLPTAEVVSVGFAEGLVCR